MKQYLNIAAFETESYVKYISVRYVGPNTRYWNYYENTYYLPCENEKACFQEHLFEAVGGSGDYDLRITAFNKDNVAETKLLSISLCVPDCTEKNCGDDCCGGSCGSCDSGKVCENGICNKVRCYDNDTTRQYPDGINFYLSGNTSNDTMTGIDYCIGNTTIEYFCSGSVVNKTSYDCKLENMACSGGSCVCIPSCEGKECCSDGCGGICGSCSDGNFCSNGVCEPEVFSVLDKDAIAVRALLGFICSDAAFSSLDELTAEQKMDLSRASAFLSDKNFLVYNGEIVLLEDIDQIDIYNGNSDKTFNQNGDYVWLEIKDQEGIIKGIELLSDVSNLDDPNDCDDFSWWDDPANCNENSLMDCEEAKFLSHVDCYCENKVKEDPSLLIGEDQAIISYVNNYLAANIPEFSSRYDVEASNDVIIIKHIDSFGPGTIIKKDGLEYDKTFQKNILQGYVNLIHDSFVGFYVIGGGLVELIITDELIEDYANDDTASTSVGNGMTGMVVNTNDFVVPCEKMSATGLPCKDRIDVFLGHTKGMSDAENYINEMNKRSWNLMDKLLDYDIVTYGPYSKDQRVGIKWVEKIFQSEGDILHLSIHGSKQFIGPFECVRNNDNVMMARQSEIRSALGWDQDKLLSCIFGGLEMSDNGVCPKGYAVLAIYGHCMKDIKKGLYISSACSGKLLTPDSLSYVIKNSEVRTKMIPGAFDIDLLLGYLIGQGPGQKISGTLYPARAARVGPTYYSMWPPDNPNQRMTHILNTNVSSYEDYGSALFPYSEMPQDYYRNTYALSDGYCYNNDDVRIPCELVALGIGKELFHLYPFVRLFGPSIDNRIYFLFSDPVTIPDLDFTDKHNDEYDFRISERDSMHTLYSFITDVTEFVFVYPPWWHSLTKNEKKEVFKGKFVLQNANSDGIPIKQIMGGNPLAYLTSANDEHGNKPYFLYDPHFWMYNARFDYDIQNKGGVNNDNNKFQASVPYMQHPWVSGVGLEGNHVEIVFSHEVRADCSNIEVDVSECAVFDSNEYKTPPVFVDTNDNGGIEKIEFKIREDARLFDFQKPPPDFNDQDHDASDWKWAAKITVSGVKSYPNDFKLMGNTKSPTFWNYDRDGENGAEKPCTRGGLKAKADEEGAHCIDALEMNSHRIPQKEGNFEIWIPCMPPKVACRVPSNWADPSQEYKDDICVDMMVEECNEYGSPYPDSVCLTSSYHGDPTKNNGVKGTFSNKCGDLYNLFDFNGQLTDSSGIPLEEDSYKVEGLFRSTATGWLFDGDGPFEKTKDEECHTGVYYWDSGCIEDMCPSLSTLKTCKSFGVCEEIDFPATGSLQCTGGSLVQSMGQDHSINFQYARYCPEGKFYVKDSIQNIGSPQCCYASQVWDSLEGKCIPIKEYFSCESS